MNATTKPKQFSAAAAGLSSVIILNDFGWVNGGQSKVAIESALQLRARGLDVCFVAGRGPVDERFHHADVECHVVGHHDILSEPNRLRAAATGIWNLAAARVAAECVNARDPDTTLIHVHGWAKALSPSIGPIVTGSRAAHVYTLHEYFLACPNGGFYDYQLGEICRRRPLGVDCLTTPCDSRADHHKMWRVARQMVLWSAGRMPSGVRELIYLAPEQLEIMRPYVPAEARWHYLPNPTGPRPAQRIFAEKNKTILFIGRLSPEKGAVVAARAARLAGVPIAFCGDGEQRQAILNVNPDAQMLGWLAEDELSKWMAQSRCLVFPSLWYETYGLVVADALRVGLPVLVSKSSVAASLVEHANSGEVVPAGDAQAWAEAIIRLKSDELTKAYSKAAFSRGQRLPGHDDHISGLIEIYANAMLRQRQSAQATEPLAS